MNHQNSRATVILVAEDEALVRMFATEVLTEDAGFKVIDVGNAEEALTILHVRPDVQVLFTDVNMPGGYDGFQLARIVNMRWPGVAIIVTSGIAVPRPGDLPTKVRFIAKPYSATALAKVIREVLDTSNAADYGAPVIPTGVHLDGIQTGLGVTGSLAQPLAEPDE